MKSIDRLRIYLPTEPQRTLSCVGHPYILTRSPSFSSTGGSDLRGEKFPTQWSSDRQVGNAIPVHREGEGREVYKHAYFNSIEPDSQTG